jgi:hypothetical protein
VEEGGGQQEVATTALEGSPMGTEATSTSDTTTVEAHKDMATAVDSTAVFTSRSNCCK